MGSRQAPIIAVVLLLLPVAYAGVYLALVKPEGRVITFTTGSSLAPMPRRPVKNYRWGGERMSIVFWPLELIDRKLRPDIWEETRFEQVR